MADKGHILNDVAGAHAFTESHSPVFLRQISPFRGLNAQKSPVTRSEPVECSPEVVVNLSHRFSECHNGRDSHCKCDTEETLNLHL
jgi:hypothetical protein